MKARFQPRSCWLASIAFGFGLCLIAAVAQAQSRIDGVGLVLAVDEASSTLSVDHGPMGPMPPMRMRLPVHKAELLRGLKKGDVIHFVLEVQDGVLQVTSIEKTAEGQ